MSLPTRCVCVCVRVRVCVVMTAVMLAYIIQLNWIIATWAKKSKLCTVATVTKQIKEEQEEDGE